MNWINSHSLRFFGAIACWAFAFHAYRAWFFPTTDSRRAWIRFGIGTLVLEMIAVVASIFLIQLKIEHGEGLFLKGGLAGAILLVVFPGAVALAFKSKELFLNFSFLLLTRWIEIASSSTHELSELENRFKLSAIIYFGVVFFTTFVAMPRGGISDEVRYAAKIPGTGLWVEHPERAISGLAIYFTLLGALVLVPGHLLPRLK